MLATPRTDTVTSTEELASAPTLMAGAVSVS